ncbi:MAG: hypothetical protein AAFN77_24420 [Planctomycetota bacterium]
MRLDVSLKANARKLLIAAGFIHLLFPLPAWSQTSDVAPHAGASSSQPPSASLQVEPRVTSNKAKNFSGTWQLIENDTQSSQRMSSIEDAIAGFGQFQQERARQMLAERTAPPAGLTLVDSGAEIKISRSGQEFIVPTNGEAVTVKSTEGRVTMRAVRRDGKLILQSKTVNATNTATYQLSPDGRTLTQQVQLQATWLSKTIQFSCSYGIQLQSQSNAAQALASSSSRAASNQSTNGGLANSSSRNLSGTWRLVSDATQSSQRSTSIENAIAGFGRFKQGRAREMLTQKTAPPAELTIVDSGDEVKIARNGQEFTVPTNGQAVSFKSPEGSVTLRAGRRDGKLVVETKSGNATQTTTFELSSDGETMTQQVQLKASALSKAIQFTSSFVR